MDDSLSAPARTRAPTTLAATVVTALARSLGLAGAADAQSSGALCRGSAARAILRHVQETGHLDVGAAAGNAG